VSQEIVEMFATLSNAPEMGLLQRWISWRWGWYLLGAGLLVAAMAAISAWHSHVLLGYGRMVRIERLTESWGMRSPDAPPPPIKREVFVGKVGGSLEGLGKITQAIDDEHVQIRFPQALVDPAKMGAGRTDDDWLVTEATISRRPLKLSTNTICGGLFHTYMLLELEPRP
jgi:hypothetical protein